MLLRGSRTTPTVDLDRETFFTRSRRSSSTSTVPAKIWFHRASSVCTTLEGCHRMRRGGLLEESSA